MSECKHSTDQAITRPDDALLEGAVEIFSAMADTARLSILLLLHKGGELCVSEIAELLNEKTNTVSMRLKKLFDASLVNKRREAKHIYYSLSDEHVVTIINNALSHANHEHV